MDETKVKLDAIRKLLELPDNTFWKKCPEKWPEGSEGEYVLGIFSDEEKGGLLVKIFAKDSTIGKGHGGYKPLWYTESFVTPDGKEVIIKRQ